MHIDSFTYSSSGWSSPFPSIRTGATGLVFVFGSASYFSDRRAVDELTAAYPGAAITGCSTAGEIHGARVLDGALSVAVAQFEKTELRTASMAVTSPDESFTVGAKLATQLLSDDLKAIFILSDGVSVNGSELLRGLHSCLPSSVVVTGGLAGDASRFEHTWVLVDGVPTERSVVAVGLYGDSVRVRHGSRGGWDMFGPERRITRSAGNVLYELDGEPALALYKTYLGERASGLPGTALLFPLALRVDTDRDKMLVRTVLGVDHERNSMTFAGDVPPGARVQLMHANFDRLVDGASEAGRAASTHCASESLSIAISCVGRRLVLGERTEEEVEATERALGGSSTLVGFYSYGEISPFTSGACSDLHNQTMTVTSFWEEP